MCRTYHKNWTVLSEKSDRATKDEFPLLRIKPAMAQVHTPLVLILL